MPSPVTKYMLERAVSAPDDVLELLFGWPLGYMFNLPADSVIVVAGAYRGLVMDLLGTIYADYGRLIGFEPQLDALKAAGERFAGRRGVELYGYALGREAGEFVMGEYGGNHAGFVNVDPSRSRTGVQGLGNGQMREIGNVFESLQLKCVDLLLLNVEGYEYTLVPYMVACGMFTAIRRLVMQVHPGMEENKSQGYPFLSALQELELTHKRVYDALPNWGYWEFSG